MLRQIDRMALANLAWSRVLRLRPYRTDVIMALRRSVLEIRPIMSSYNDEFSHRAQTALTSSYRHIVQAGIQHGCQRLPRYGIEPGLTPSQAQQDTGEELEDNDTNHAAEHDMQSEYATDDRGYVSSQSRPSTTAQPAD